MDILCCHFKAEFTRMQGFAFLPLEMFIPVIAVDVLLSDT